MSKMIKRQYFHICGMRTVDEHDGTGSDPNYFRATLEYVTGEGYIWNIRPVIRYTVNGVRMEGDMYGLSVAVPSLCETLIHCARFSKRREQEAVELFDSNVFSAIIHRLKYRVEVSA